VGKKMITPSFGLSAIQPASTKKTLDWTAGNAQTGVDVIRAGNATQVNSLGYVEAVIADTQRVDWTGGSPALLVEPAASNFLRDNTFQNSVGTTSGENIWWRNANIAVTNNSVASPDGTNNAALVAATTNTSFQAVQYWTARSVAGIYTFSIYVKPNSTDTNCGIRLANSTAYTNRIGYVFSLVGNGSVGNVTVAGSGVTQAAVPTIAAVSNGWYRISISADMASASSVSVVVFPGTTGAQTTNSQTCVWGAQLEENTKATSLIFTTTATETRNADLATMTGSNFSDWFNASKGTFRVDFTSIASGTRPVIAIDDNSANESMVVKTQGNVPTFEVINGGSPQASVEAGTVTANTTAFAYVSYGENFFGIARPSARQVDTLGTVPSVDRMRIGSDEANNFFNGRIQKIQFWS
jgi:hypothetical protein